MGLNHLNKLAFCAVPRAGGQSICKALNLDVSDGHRPCSWYRAKYPDYHLFCVFRPFKERLKSGYCYELTDEDIEERMSRLKCGKMYYSNDYYIDEMPDTMIRFTHLEYDLNTMLTKLDLPTVNLLNVDIHRKENIDPDAET